MKRTVFSTPNFSVYQTLSGLLYWGSTVRRSKPVTDSLVVLPEAESSLPDVLGLLCYLVETCWHCTNTHTHMHSESCAIWLKDSYALGRGIHTYYVIVRLECLYSDCLSLIVWQWLKILTDSQGLTVTSPNLTLKLWIKFPVNLSCQ